MSKSAYASITLQGNRFFSSFEVNTDERKGIQKFACQMLNRALLAVFKPKSFQAKAGDLMLERCEVTITDGAERAKCRLNIKMFHVNGVTKIHRLTYESVEVMHALFDKNRAINTWKIKSRLLREFIDYFGAKTEQLDIYAENGRVTLTSYTEKIMNGKEVLKQPLQTAISIDTQDFEGFDVVDNLHITINVKDFKTVVTHAHASNAIVTAMYSQPSKPLQFSYQASGMRCEFTLMTIGGELHSTAVSRATTREPPSRPVSVGPTRITNRSLNSDMPPPQRPASRTVPQQTRRLGSNFVPSQHSVNGDPDPDSLFLPADDDGQWEPAEERDQDEDMLGWDTNADNDAPFRSTFQDSNSASRFRESEVGRAPVDADAGIAPTQRASQMKGLFD